MKPIDAYWLAEIRLIQNSLLCRNCNQNYATYLPIANYLLQVDPAIYYTTENRGHTIPTSIEGFGI